MSTFLAQSKCRCNLRDWKNHGSDVEVKKRKPKAGNASQNASSVIYKFRVMAKAAGISSFILVVFLHVSPSPGESVFTCDDVTKICKLVKDVAEKVAAGMNIEKIYSDTGKEEFNKRLTREVVIHKLGYSDVAALINSVTSKTKKYNHEKTCSGSTS